MTYRQQHEGERKEWGAADVQLSCLDVDVQRSNSDGLIFRRHEIYFMIVQIGSMIGFSRYAKLDQNMIGSFDV